MSPKEFEEKMKELEQDEDENGDTEEVHRCMDDLMCKVLSELGFGEGVKIFYRTYKWYA